MNIAVLGTGSVGQALAGKLLELGYTVFMGTRDPEVSRNRTQPDGRGNPALGTWLQSHPAIQLLTYGEATKKADRFIVHAMHGFAAIESLEAAHEADLKGKILVDITNPLDFSKGFPPTLFVCNTDSLGEQIQRRFPDLHVVKTLNTVNAQLMVNPALVPGDHSIFLSGNEEEAKNETRALLHQFGWRETMIHDLGDITTARGTEMMLPMWVRLYGSLKTPMFNWELRK